MFKNKDSILLSILHEIFEVKAHEPFNLICKDCGEEYAICVVNGKHGDYYLPIHDYLSREPRMN